MNFTQEQFDYITELIESKVDAKIKKGILSFKKKKNVIPREQFHSSLELRAIILANQDFLRSELNYEPFRVHAIIHCVRKLITLRPADYQMLGNGMIRLDSHVFTCLKNWPDSPFEAKPDHPRHFCWKQS
jgi:hypothetical protein